MPSDEDERAFRIDRGVPRRRWAANVAAPTAVDHGARAQIRRSLPLYDPDFDFDGDGWVDGQDLAYLASNMGRCWDGAAWTLAACPANLR